MILKRLTMLSRRSAVPASCWAEAAISWVDALVCCVEAETCSAEAEDCSATAATSAMSFSARCASALIWCTAVAMSLTRRGDVGDGEADGLEGLAGLLDRGDAVGGAAAALFDDQDDVLGLGLDLADQRGDLTRGALGLLGELADFLGDDGEAAALLAGAGGLDGGVEREEVGLLGDAGDGVDDAADLGGLGGEALHGGADLRAGALDLADRVGGLRGGADAVLGDPAGLLGGFGGGRRGLGAGAGGAGRFLHGLSGGLDHADLALGAMGDVGDGGGDLADGATGLLGGGRHLLRGGGDGPGTGRDLGDARR